MKALTCEMCGSTNLVKQDGVFVCQSCGTKYSIEEARKMMVEGTVNVQGTVKVDKTEESNNLLSLALASIESLNGEEAYAYANRALESNPSNPEAWFLKMKAVGLTAILKDLKVLDVVKAGNKAIELSNGEKAEAVYSYYLQKMLNDLKFCMNQLADTESIKKIFEINSLSNFVTAAQKTLNSDTICSLILQQVDLVVLLRDHVPDSAISSNEGLATQAREVSKQWVFYVDALKERFKVYGATLNDATVTKYNNILIRLKQGLPQEMQAEIQEQKITKETSGGCYVATAVYGSYDCPEVWTLRRFRDNTLAETWYGRAFIHTYYAISPTLVKWFGQTSWFKNICKSPLDKLVRNLQSKGIDSSPYNDRI